MGSGLSGEFVLLAVWAVGAALACLEKALTALSSLAGCFAEPGLRHPHSGLPAGCQGGPLGCAPQSGRCLGPHFPPSPQTFAQLLAVPHINLRRKEGRIRGPVPRASRREVKVLSKCSERVS